MADVNYVHNIGGLGDLKRLSDHGTSTAAGTGDATSITGITIDRLGFGSGAPPQSALFGVLYEATLASGATLSIGYSVQDSADGTNFSDFQTATYAVASTGASGGSTNKGSFNVQVDLTNARRYVRFNYNPDLSATGTDTSYSDGVGFFAGSPTLPASNA